MRHSSGLDLDQKQIGLQLSSAKRAEEFVFFLPVRGLAADTLFDVERVRTGHTTLTVDQADLR